MSEFGKVTVTVEVEVNPTEDLDKVRDAVKNLLGELPLEVVEEKDGKRLAGKTEGLDSLTIFQEALRRERIRNAARRVLLRCVRGDAFTFYLNKQVAYVGHVSFSQSVGESPLGPIKVEVRCDKPRELIEWLAAKTAQ